MVVTDLLQQEVGWKAGESLLSAAVGDPAGFAAAVERLYGDEALWQRVRQSALEAVRRDTDLEQFRHRVKQIVDASLN